MKGLLIDLDGVLYQGAHLVDGALATMAWLDDERIPYVFVTNTTSRPRAALLAKLRDLGIKTTLDHLLTPPIAAVRWLKARNATKVVLFVPEVTHEDFLTLEVLPSDTTEIVDAIVLGDLAKAWSYEKLNRAFNLLNNDPKTQLVALGKTRYWRTESGLNLDVGPYVAALEYATGRDAVVVGKPALDFFAVGLDMIGTTAQETAMVGDDIKGDIQAAQEVDLTGVLVKTGKFQPSDLESHPHPDVVLNSIADVPDWIQSTRAKN